MAERLNRGVAEEALLPWVARAGCRLAESEGPVGWDGLALLLNDRAGGVGFALPVVRRRRNRNLPYRSCSIGGVEVCLTGRPASEASDLPYR